MMFHKFNFKLMDGISLPLVFLEDFLTLFSGYLLFISFFLKSMYCFCRLSNRSETPISLFLK
ncbi:hypothetical protein ER614_01075 [Streptococcus pyogenes]|nr:hypothetical protein ETT60_04580 [Streptococcus pyogenes]RXS33730.1 hypothetical protein ER614_01075 [Streptococcus pyogenes]